MNTFYKSSPGLIEAQSLEALRSLRKIDCVKVVEATENSITLEKLRTEFPSSQFWNAFGRRLAEMHSVRKDYFGFETDNFIGRTPQPNPKKTISEISWADYFIEFRLEHMLSLAPLKQNAQVQAAFVRSRPNIYKILSEVTEQPSLVHGDLWSGNFLCTDGQTPVLIDPATYSGHREVDIAMSRLFGGFDPEFYEAYQATLPLEEGHERRSVIYNLYHLMNHWILFGGSYANQTLHHLAELSK